MDLRSALALEAAPAALIEPPADSRDPRRYAARDKTRDGTFVHIHAVRPNDPNVYVGLVATVWIEGSERVVGQASLLVDPWSEPSRAELKVVDAWQGRGIDSLLFAHLLRVARKCEIDMGEPPVATLKPSRLSNRRTGSEEVLPMRMNMRRSNTMRATIAGFLTASLYTFAIASLFAMSMPSQADLQAYIDATRNPVVMVTAEAIETEAAN